MIGKVIGMGDVEKPRLKREWKGRHVVTRVELRNGWGVVPAGTRMVVDENRRASTRTPGSLALATETRCVCCGLRAIVSGVRELDVELLPKDAPPEGPRPVSTTDLELQRDLQTLQELADANGLDMVTELRGAVVSQIRYVREKAAALAAGEPGWADA